MQSSTSRYGKKEKGQGPRDLDFGYSCSKAANCGGQATERRVLLDRRNAGACRRNRGGPKEGLAIGPKKEDGGALR